MSETPKTPHSNPDQPTPEQEWPQGMFPSPIVNEHFNPYDNLQDRQIYQMLGGSRDEILKYATVMKLRQMQSEPGAYPDVTESAESVQASSEHLERQRRIREQKWPEQT